MEIINPDLYLFTVDSDEAFLEIEMTAETGRGYSPAEEQRGRLPIGELPVDAIFSPIRASPTTWRRRVSVRMQTYDRLIMEIWTDGTMRPEEALAQDAARF